MIFRCSLSWVILFQIGVSGSRVLRHIDSPALESLAPGFAKVSSTRRFEDIHDDLLSKHLQNSSLVMLDLDQSSNAMVDPLTAFGLAVLAKHGIELSAMALIAFKVLLGTVWGTTMAGAATRFTDEADRFFLCKAWRGIGDESFKIAQIRFPCAKDDGKHEYKVRLAYEVLHSVCRDAEKEGALAHGKGWLKKWVQAVNIFDPHVLKETAKWTLGWHVLAGELPINTVGEKVAENMGGGLINFGAAVLLTAPFQGSEIKAMLCSYAQSVVNNPNIIQMKLSTSQLTKFQEARDYCRSISCWADTCPTAEYQDPGMLKNIWHGFTNFASYAQTKGANFADKLFKSAYKRSDYLQQVFRNTVYDPNQQGYQGVDEHELRFDDAVLPGQRLTRTQYLERQKSLYDKALGAAATLRMPVQLKFKSSELQQWRIDYSLVQPNGNCLASIVDLGEARSVYECAIKALLEDRCGVGSWFATNALNGAGECSCQANRKRE